MPYIRKHDVSGETEEIAIFVILSPFDKSCFVWKTPINKLRDIYKYHYYLNSPKTKELFERARENNIVPPMYHLQTVDTSQKKAFLYCIAWTKLFEDHGYVSISGEVIDKYTDELREETYKIYESIKEVPLNEICSEGNDLFPDFGRERKKNKTKKKTAISFLLDDKELETVKSAAEQNGLTLADYCKQSSLNGRVVKVDVDAFDLISECYKEFSARNKVLMQILIEIHRTGNYIPADLKIIQEAVNENKKQQQKMFKDLRKTLNELIK